MKYVLAFVIVGLLLALYGCSGPGPGPGTNASYDSFAKCLTNKSAKMYGASWCPHCQNMKAAFGDSWKYVTYVECADPVGGQTQACTDAGIRGYPTWTFKDGSAVEGEMSLQDLANRTGCQLPP